MAEQDESALVAEAAERFTCKRCRKLFLNPKGMGFEQEGECSCPDNPLKVQMKVEEEAVGLLCDAIGYGRVMQLGEQLWRKKLESDPTRYGGPPGGEHTVGPCAVFMVPCGCRVEGLPEDKSSCDWCCGNGRVTKHVRAVQMATNAFRKSGKPSVS